MSTWADTPLIISMLVALATAGLALWRLRARIRHLERVVHFLTLERDGLARDLSESIQEYRELEQEYLQLEWSDRAVTLRGGQRRRT